MFCVFFSHFSAHSLLFFYISVDFWVRLLNHLRSIFFASAKYKCIFMWELRTASFFLRRWPRELTAFWRRFHLYSKCFFFFFVYFCFFVLFFFCDCFALSIVARTLWWYEVKPNQAKFERKYRKEINRTWERERDELKRTRREDIRGKNWFVPRFYLVQLWL